MGINFDEIKDKAQHAVKGEHVDKAADRAKSKFGAHSDQIDAAAEKAKGFLSGGRSPRHASGEAPESRPGDGQAERGGRHAAGDDDRGEESGGHR